MLNLSPANINDGEYNIYGTTILGEGKAKNKTIKNHKTGKNNVKQDKMNILQNIQKLYDDNNDDDSNMENHEEVDASHSGPREADNHFVPGEEDNRFIPGEEDNSLGPDEEDNGLENFENIDTTNMNLNDYYKKSMPMYSEASIHNGERDELLKKLNYMIHLLEEQRNERI